MRLLHVDRLDFTKFQDDQKPPYVTASHRWLSRGETTFQDVRDRRNTNSEGYQKVEAFAAYIRQHLVPIKWLWIDTCCIDKDSTAELSQAINSMFRWYRDAELCLAYLADVEMAENESSFEKSQWFRRGWTLQELLAPRTVLFVTKKWHVIGHKGQSAFEKYRPPVGRGLEKTIAYVTGIPEEILHDYDTSKEWTVQDKMKWIEGRETTEPEDMAYALFGILSVTLPVIYGEGKGEARRRLLDVIHLRDDTAVREAEQYRNITDWLAPPDPWKNHDSARQLHQPHTGTWLLESAQYQSWRAGTVRHVWMYGKAGCGKTILCSTAIAEVRAYCESQSETGFAIFYFSFSDNKKQQLIDLLRSLVVQLGWKGRARSMLQQAYDKPNRTALGLDELDKILLACFQDYREVALLLDALDECPGDGDVRHKMLEYLAGLSQKAPRLKVFATSRELSDIRQAMRSLRAEAITAAVHLVDQDIRQYIAAQLSRHHGLSRLSQETKRDIEDTISTKADGMFRWAYCQLQELKKLKGIKPKYIREALRNLPPTLDDTYARMLRGIDDMFRNEAVTLLQWLAYAKSPPSLGELMDATLIDITGEGHVDIYERGGLQDTLEILSGLVVTVGDNTRITGSVNKESESEHEVDNERSGVSDWNNSDYGNNEGSPECRYRSIGESTTVRLAHFSVKEYLESKRILKSDVKEFYLESTVGHRLLAQSCITYLLHYSKSDEKLSTVQDLANFPLLRYAAQSWFHHYSLQQEEEPARALFLLSSKDTKQDWLRVHQPDQAWAWPFESMEGFGSGLYYAGLLGLERVAKQLLANVADINAEGWRGNALQAALSGGHEKVVQVLMDAGAEVNAQGGHFGNALQAASSGGHEKVVQVLMDAGAEVNAQGGHFGTALQAASSGGYEKVVQLLVNAGAEDSAHEHAANTV